MNDNFIAAKNNLAFSYYKANKFEKSIDLFLHIINQQPNYAQAYNNLGIVYLDLDDYDKAENNFKKALKLKSDYLKHTIIMEIHF